MHRSKIESTALGVEGINRNVRISPRSRKVHMPRRAAKSQPSCKRNLRPTLARVVGVKVCKEHFVRVGEIESE